MLIEGRGLEKAMMKKKFVLVREFVETRRRRRFVMLRGGRRL